MNEDEAGAEATEKKRIPLWPSVVMLIMMFVYWFFIYNNFFLLMIAIVMTFYWFSCLLACPCMLAFGLRYSICVLIPVLLPVISGLVFIPLSFVMTVTTPIRKTLFHSRDYVEFFIYDRCHHIKDRCAKADTGIKSGRESYTKTAATRLFTTPQTRPPQNPSKRTCRF